MTALSPEQPIFGNPFGQLDTGCQLDLRAKLAIEFLKSPQAILTYDASNPLTPAEKVGYAMDLAAEVIRQAAARGWARDLPETDELPRSVRIHVNASARTNIAGQMATQRIAQEEAPKLSLGIAIPPSKLNDRQ